MKVGDIFALRLSHSAGFRGQDLSFLEEFPALRSIEVYSTNIRSLEPLRHLGAIEVLGLQTQAVTKICSLDFPALRVALVQWRRGMDELLSVTTLEHLNVINYPHANLDALAKLHDLKRLAITSRKLISLTGIESLTELVELDLYSCPNLLSVEPARDRSPHIKIEVESCRHIRK
jgi:Leucine-rich repeat (LRR) protein